MGSSARTSSNSNSVEYSNSNNTTVTNSVGAGGLGVIGDIAGGLNMQTDSNNVTGSYNNTYADTFSLGAGSSAIGSSNNPSSGVGSPDLLGSGINWNDIIVYVIGGIILYFVLKYLGRSKGGT